MCIPRVSVLIGNSHHVMMIQLYCRQLVHMVHVVVRWKAISHVPFLSWQYTQNSSRNRRAIISHNRKDDSSIQKEENSTNIRQQEGDDIRHQTTGRKIAITSDNRKENSKTLRNRKKIVADHRKKNTIVAIVSDIRQHEENTKSSNGQRQQCATAHTPTLWDNLHLKPQNHVERHPGWKWFKVFAMIGRE